MRKKTITQYKKDTWTIFSKYIRLKYASINGDCMCVTCGQWKHWKEMQAGHFLDGRTNSILFEENCVHPQCYTCNCMKSGNKVEYTLYMLHKYGRTEVDRLRKLKNTIKKISRSEYEIMQEDLKRKIKDLEIGLIRCT